MSKTINISQLTPNATVLVKGQVVSSRITRRTTDEEREAANKLSQDPIGRNYTAITLYNAQVAEKDPQNPTIEEKYAAECFFSSDKYPGNNFTAVNKSKYLPRVAVIDPDKPKTYNEIRPDGELQSGLDVTIVICVYDDHGTNDVLVDRILVNEPIKYSEN